MVKTGEDRDGLENLQAKFFQILHPGQISLKYLRTVLPFVSAHKYFASRPPPFFSFFFLLIFKPTVSNVKVFFLCVLECYECLLVECISLVPSRRHFGPVTWRVQWNPGNEQPLR